MAKVPAQNAWSTSLCDCAAEPSGCGFCLFAWCCQPCAYGMNVELMEPVVCCGGDCCGACMAYYCVAIWSGCHCILHTMARGYIRNKYNIPGDCCSDCMTTWCCAPCALCQERRELLLRGHTKGGKVPPSAQPPQQQVMVMVPQPGMQPAYPAPAQPAYPAPAQPGYPAPAQPAYPAPAQPAYPAPAQPGYPAPAQPGYPAPAQPGYPAPAQPAYPAPAQPGYPAPAQPGYAMQQQQQQPAFYPEVPK